MQKDSSTSTTSPSSPIAYLIFSSHRSGSSCLAGSFSICGCYPGKRVIGSRDANSKGHFENQIIVNVNEFLLGQACNKGWATVRTDDFERLGSLEDYIEKTTFSAVRGVAKCELKEMLEVSSTLVIKDPRLSLTFNSFWKGLLEELGIDYEVICVRRPLPEIASSINARDSTGYAAARDIAETYSNSIDNLDIPKTKRKVTIFYDTLLSDPVGSMQMIERALRREFPINPTSVKDALNNFVDPTLRTYKKDA